MKRKEFMKLFYEDWLEGTDGLTLEQEGAYLRIVIAIYKRGKPLPNRPETIRHMLRKSKKWTEDTIAFLISEGKLKIDQDGCLYNERALFELKDREEKTQQKIEAGRSGGLTRAENAKKIEAVSVAPDRDEVVVDAGRHKFTRKQVDELQARFPSINVMAKMIGQKRFIAQKPDHDVNEFVNNLLNAAEERMKKELHSRAAAANATVNRPYKPSLV